MTLYARPRAPTAASPTRAGGCCRGRSTPDSTTSRPTGSLWCFATPETRDWWGGMWADRIVESALARQLIDIGMATTTDLDEIATAWRQWAAAPDGWLGDPARRDPLPRGVHPCLVNARYWHSLFWQVRYP